MTVKKILDVYDGTCGYIYRATWSCPTGGSSSLRFQYFKKNYERITHIFSTKNYLLSWTNAGMKDIDEITF